MDYTKKFAELSFICHSHENKVVIDDEIEMIHLPFNSENHWQKIWDEVKQIPNDQSILPVSDSQFFENLHFSYPVFMPKNKNKKFNKAILLLHGLNERTWDKYFPWAYYLAKLTQRPVILFPLAFHVNRAPKYWIDPKRMVPLVSERKSNFKTDSLTYVNAALSIRLTEEPLRFLKSGHQSAEDLILLINQMEKGLINIFEKGTQVNIFAYSIGAFISQILYLAYPNTLFKDKKLFIFCGGAYFNDMNGISRLIMDQKAYEVVHNYYKNDINEVMNRYLLLKSLISEFPLGKAFYSMLTENNNRAFREEGLLKTMDRIKGITLVNDKVIPAKSTEKLFGVISNEYQNVQMVDFPYEYSHEVPFPISSKTDHREVDQCFANVFTTAAEYLA